MSTNITRAQRLDRLPFTRRHGQLLVGSGVGWALDAMDVGLISFVMVALTKAWGLSQGTVAWIGSIGFVGMAIGAGLGGWLADRVGRRTVFAATLILYGLATAASALVPGTSGGLVAGLALLMVLRFLVGLGLGAELPVASTLVSEFAPARIRGRMVVGLEAFWAVGWLLAALLGYLVIPHRWFGIDGWRVALAVGVVPMLYAVVVRRSLPESVRFLEDHGREAEAEASVVAYEESAGVSGAVEAPGATAAPQPAAVRPSGATSIWSRELRGRTVALWLVWFGVNFSYYGAFIWIPGLLFAQGMTISKSFEFTLIITLAQLPGYAVAAWLIEVWGRRATLASFLLGSAISAGLFGFADNTTQILVFGCMLSFFNLGAWGALYAIGPELYPTHLRGAGTGAAAGFGRIASIIAPLSVPYLLRWGGGSMHLAFGVFAAAFLVAAAATLTLPELRRHKLAD